MTVSRPLFVGASGMSRPAVSRWRNSVRCAANCGQLHFGPSHNLHRPTVVELVSCGPRPLYWSAGGQTRDPPSGSIPILIIRPHVLEDE